MTKILKFRGHNKILIYEIKETIKGKSLVKVTIKHKFKFSEKVYLSFYLNLILNTATTQIKNMIDNNRYVLEYEENI